MDSEWVRDPGPVTMVPAQRYGTTSRLHECPGAGPPRAAASARALRVARLGRWPYKNFSAFTSGQVRGSVKDSQSIAASDEMWGGNQMRRSFAMPGLATIVTLGALALAGSPGSLASPGEERPSAPSKGAFISDGPGPLDQDNRKGRVEPTARQRALAVAVEARARFNDLGTPGVLTSTGRPLASRLPSDPVAAARAYVAGNRELLGLTPRAASSLEVVTVAPMGDGAAVLLQQRFGNLVAGYDGLLVVGVRDGMVFHVSGSLARDAAEPVAFSSFVDARDGSLMVREDLVDYDTDNPEWEVFPNTPPVDYSSTDTRVRWCFAPGPGCDEVVGTSASPLAWDIDPSNRK